MSMKENIEEIRQKIRLAAQSSGRSEDDITLVAVSKTVSPERIKEAAENGITTFGESYVQEFILKKDELNGIEWHFIGQLQSNKVKYIFRDISMLHSLDRMSLAKELDKRLNEENRTLNVLVQINIGREPQKGGIMPDKAEKFIASLSELNSIDVSGLMCIPPFSNTQDETIRDFAATKKIFDDLRGAGFNMRYLSMGMSGDYEDAIKHGANIVRIGSAIFGKRA